MRKTVVACAVTALVASAGSATAASLITSADIQDGAIKNRDIAKNTVSLNRLTPGLQRAIKRATAVQQTSASQNAPAPGAPGAPGAKGDTGAAGANGKDGARGADGANGADGADGADGVDGVDGADGVVPGAGNWGVINRNTIGSPVAELRRGPSSGAGAAINPPNGDGSLNLNVRGVPEAPSSPTDQRQKIAYGNEVDYVGTLIPSLDAVGFWIYTTGENSGRGTNMPNITFEVDPNLVGGSGTNYSSLVFNPAANSVSNAWSPYIDATQGATWNLTGAAATETGCTLAAPCTWSEIKTKLPAATILSVAVGKGRDYSWQGAIDALRIGGQIVDFEENGVLTRAAG